MRIRMSIFRPFMTFNRRPEHVRSWPTKNGHGATTAACPFRSLRHVDLSSPDMVSAEVLDVRPGSSLFGD
jgi:hypothetical protein